MLHEHMRTSSNHSYKCPSCDMHLGTSLVQVVLHTRKFCSREKFMQAETELVKARPNHVRYYCERCKKGLPALSLLLKHYLEDHKGQILCCSECDKTSANFLGLSHHFGEHVDPVTGKLIEKKTGSNATKAVANENKVSDGSASKKSAEQQTKVVASEKQVSMKASATSSSRKPTSEATGPSKNDKQGSKTASASTTPKKGGSEVTKPLINDKQGLMKVLATSTPKKAASEATKPSPNEKSVPIKGSPLKTSTPKKPSPEVSKSNGKEVTVKPSEAASEAIKPIAKEKRASENVIASSDKSLTRGQPFYCHKCGLKFSNFEKLHHHMFQTADHAFHCAKCEFKVGQTLVNIIVHTKRFCSRDEFRKSEEKMALKVPNQTRYYCERCGKGAATLTDLFRHYLGHKDRRLLCSQCDKKFSTFMELLLHFREHTVVGNVHLKCQMCPLKFYAVEPFKLHYFIAHSRVSGIPYECDLCQQVLVDDDEKFLFHVQGHSIINKEIKRGRPAHDVSKLTCEVCAKICDSTDQCKAHKAETHQMTADSTRECPICHEKIIINTISSHLWKHQKEKADKLSKQDVIKEDLDEEDSANDVEKVEEEQDHHEKESYTSKPTVTYQPLVSTPPVIQTQSVVADQSRPAPYTTGPSFGSLKFNQPKCTECGKTFFTMFALNEHMKSHLLDKVTSLRSKGQQTNLNPWTTRTPVTFHMQNANWSSLYKEAATGATYERRATTTFVQTFVRKDSPPPASLFERRHRSRSNQKHSSSERERRADSKDKEANSRYKRADSPTRDYVRRSERPSREERNGRQRSPYWKRESTAHRSDRDGSRGERSRRRSPYNKRDYY